MVDTERRRLLQAFIAGAVGYVVTGAADSVLGSNSALRPRAGLRLETPFYSREFLIPYLKKEALDLDYEKLVLPETKMLALKMMYVGNAVEREILSHLPDFAQLGFTHLLLEIDSGAQPALNRYPAPEAKAFLRVLLHEFSSKWLFKPAEAYEQLIEAAYRHKIQPVAIGLPREYYNESNDDWESVKKRQALQLQYAAAMIDSVLRHRQNRVILIGGDLVTSRDREFLLGGRYSRVWRPREVVSMGFVGLDADPTPFPPNLPKREGNPLREVAKELGIEHTRFVIPQRRKFSRFAYDWVAHLPKASEEIPAINPQTI